MPEGLSAQEVGKEIAEHAKPSGQGERFDRFGPRLGRSVSLHQVMAHDRERPLGEPALVSRAVL